MQLGQDGNYFKKIRYCHPCNPDNFVWQFFLVPQLYWGTECDGKTDRLSFGTITNSLENLAKHPSSEI